MMVECRLDFHLSVHEDQQVACDYHSHNNDKVEIYTQKFFDWHYRTKLAVV